MSYLERLIANHQVAEEKLKILRIVREELESVLTGGWKTGDPRFYYGGSFAKYTMIDLAFDLDLVVYFPPTDQFTVQVLYESVERRLLQKNYKLTRHNVALRLPYTEGFNVDVVPGRVINYDYLYANLWASEFSKTKQTSIKKHIDLVRKNGGYQDVVKILKIWKVRHGISVGSFTLELATAKALSSSNSGTLEDRVMRVLQWLRDSFRTARLEDPANSTNVVSDDISDSLKSMIERVAGESSRKPYWEEIVW